LGVRIPPGLELKAAQQEGGSSQTMFGKVGAFFSESRQELGKVNWPTRQELSGSTLLVVVVTLLMSAFIFIVDLILSFLIRIAIR
jgi:preprotein translocase subunit SecE